MASEDTFAGFQLVEIQRYMELLRFPARCTAFQAGRFGSDLQKGAPLTRKQDAIPWPQNIPNMILVPFDWKCTENMWQVPGPGKRHICLVVILPSVTTVQVYDNYLRQCPSSDRRRTALYALKRHFEKSLSEKYPNLPKSSWKYEYKRIGTIQMGCPLPMLAILQIKISAVPEFIKMVTATGENWKAFLLKIKDDVRNANRLPGIHSVGAAPDAEVQECKLCKKVEGTFALDECLKELFEDCTTERFPVEMAPEVSAVSGDEDQDQER